MCLWSWSRKFNTPKTFNSSRFNFIKIKNFRVSNVYFYKGKSKLQLGGDNVQHT